MKYTLLEMVQRILSAMQSDEVNSISDTVESLDVANIIKENYNDIIGDRTELPENKGLFQLDAFTDITKPLLATVPSNVIQVDWLKYNSETSTDPKFYDLKYMPFKDFYSMLMMIDLEDDNTQVMSLSLPSGVTTVKFRNNQTPNYYTSYNDNLIMFDSLDTSKDDTIVSAKTLAYGIITPEFLLSDTFVPDLEPQQFQLLLQRSKSQAFLEEKQISNPDAERKAKRNAVNLQKRKAVDQRGGQQTYRRYGR